jgi:hypothetical protein
MMKRSLEARSRAELHARLEGRADAIKEAVLVRIRQIDSTRKVSDPTYVASLELAVRAAIAHSLEAVQRGAERVGPAPPALRAQAALAARNGVGLDVVLRRCAAGHALLGSFIVDEAEALGMSGEPLRNLLQDHAATFQGLISTVSQEYSEEDRSHPRSSSQRQFEQVRRLLAGELTGAADLDYELDGAHLAVALAGTGCSEVLRETAVAIGRPRTLIVGPDETSCWAWLGAVPPNSRAALPGLLRGATGEALRIGIGEFADGIEGWRLSHRQAIAALLVAQSGPSSCVLYRDQPLTAAAFVDDLLAFSLRQLYLEPLEEEKDGGESVRRTLRAYFSCERNVSSASASLGVSRNTVMSRLATAERRIGRPLFSCAAGLEVALSLQLLDGSQTTPA